jgi:hypothetical protein
MTEFNFKCPTSMGVFIHAINTSCNQYGTIQTTMMCNELTWLQGCHTGHPEAIGRP